MQSENNSESTLLSDSESNDQAVSPGKENKPFYREILEAVAIAVVLAIVIRLFVFEPFYIPSESMVPTLKVNDKIIVSKLNYKFKQPQRGDVVVFKYPKDTSVDYVKRLIAVGGETVEMRNNVLYINGQAVSEEYLPKGMIYSNFGPVEVSEGHYFMLGDNRNRSEDSRFWGFVSEDLLIGKAVVIFWPPSRTSLVQ